MMPAGKPKDGQPKRRSFIVEAFNPHIGDSIRPVSQSFSLIVNLIAIIFAGQGLFPRNHPALTGEPGAPKLYLRDVFATAWSNLSFTKEGLPKVLIFFAVIGSIVVSIFAVFAILMALMTGSAHAQGACPAQGCFTPANTTNDLAYNLIDYLFSPTNSVNGYNNLNTQYGQFAGGTLPNVNIQGALWSALSMYSGAMLIFAAIILFYHLASMVVDTAHSGVTMGKRANQIWAPIRLVAAVILLVPVANGLNSGQIVVLKMAQWGSGLASNVWDTFRTQWITLSATAGGPAAPPAPNVGTTVTTLAQMAACEYKYNFEKYQEGIEDQGLANQYSANNGADFVNGWTNGFPGYGGTAWSANTDPTLPASWGGAPSLVTTNPDGSTTYHFQPPSASSDEQDVCGSYTIQAPPTGLDASVLPYATNIYNAQINAFNTALTSIMHYGINEQQFLPIPGAAEGNIDMTASGPAGISINMEVANFQSNLNTQLAAATGAGAGMTDKYLGVGWLGAGAFFNQISNKQAIIDSSAMTYLPSVKAPTYDVSDFTSAMNSSMDNISSTTEVLPPIVNTTGGGCPNTQITFDSTKKEIMKMFTPNLMNAILGVGDFAAGALGVWCINNSTIGVRFTGSNPLHQIAGWGHQNIEAGSQIFSWGMWLMVAGGIGSTDLGKAMLGVTAAATGGWSIGSWISKHVLGNGAAPGASFTGPIAIFATLGLMGQGAVYLGASLLPMAAMFLTIGFTFGYLIPLLPFMHFFFGAMTWVTTLFEAVVAMPLVALAHINPEGEGLPGSMARNAYFMAFSILLRPVLMIFGLIFGFMILMLAISFLNIFFSGAMSITAGPATASASDTVFLAKFIYTILYVVIMLSVANHAFRLISHIPNVVMGWIGAQSVRGEQMGSPEQIEQKATLAAGYMSTRAAGAVGNAGQKIGGMIESAGATRTATARANAQQGALNTLVTDSGLNSQRLGSIATNMSRAEGHLARTEANTSQTAANTGQTATNTQQTATNTQQIPDIRNNTDRIP